MRFIFVFLLLTSFTVSAQKKYDWENNNLVRGERLSYNIKYGWLKIGEAEILNDPEFEMIEGTPYYHIQFRLTTVGWFRVFANLDLCFESYVNAMTLQPYKATRMVINGNKTNVQFDEFLYADSIRVKTFRQETKRLKEHGYSYVGAAFNDALSSYLFLRAKDLNMDKDEHVRVYITNRILEFGLTPTSLSRKEEGKKYQMIFPKIEEFPRNKISYVILSKDRNIPIEFKLASNKGNFYLILDEKG